MTEAHFRAADLIAAVGAAEANRQPARTLIRQFFAARQAAGLVPGPVVEGTQITFLYMGRPGGPDSTVVLSSERDGWPADAPRLDRVGASALYYRVEELDPTARFLYRYEVNGRRLADPLNPLQALKEQWAPKSELRMPGYVPAPERTARPEVARGQVQVHALTSGALGGPRPLQVYTPPGFGGATPTGGYPFVLFHDGSAYLKYAGAMTILDNLIAQRVVPPIVAAFTTPVRRNLEYGLNDAQVAFAAGEIPAFVAALYPGVATDPTRRAVLGASLGGLSAIYVAWRRPDVYGLVGSYSGYTAYDGYRVERLVAEQAAQPLAFYLVAGQFERSLNRPHAPAGGPNDLLDNQRRFAAVLAGQGYPYRALEYSDGHNWGFWADHLAEVLRWMLAR